MEFTMNIIDHAALITRRFTLIELQVVIAIITVRTLRLLLAVFSKANTKATVVKCLSNLKTLSIASTLYYDPADDYMPHCWNKSFWQLDWREMQLAQNNNGAGISQLTGPLSRPSESRLDIDDITLRNAWEGIHYVMNRFLGNAYAIGREHLPGYRKISSAQTPGSTCLNNDNRKSNTALPFYHIRPRKNNACKRHYGAAQFVMLDGCAITGKQYVLKYLSGIYQNDWGHIT